MTILKKYLQLIYTLWATIYDFIDRLYTFDRHTVIRALNIKKGERILEIGVGTGLNLPLYPKHCNVYGIDFSNAMLAKARQKKHAATVTIVTMDATQLDFPAAFFDKALATYVLRVAPEPQRVLHEIHRTLKPNGRFVILDRFATKTSFLRKLTEPVRILFGSGKDYLLEDILKNTSFRIEKKKPFGTWRNTFLVVLEKDKIKS